MRLLVSVRSLAEARLARGGGADFIDLKEPREGALGGLPLAAIRGVVDALAADARALGTAPTPLSATIGDLPARELAQIVERARAVAACGVDLVKVGIDARDGEAQAAQRLLDALAASALRVMPVFIADEGIDERLVAQACALGFAGVMVDTAGKLGGSLLERVPAASLRGFIAQARAAGLQLVGLAGALRAADLPQLDALRPDFAGFRSAVCAGGRAAALSPERLRALVAARDALACGAGREAVAEPLGAG